MRERLKTPKLTSVKEKDHDTDVTPFSFSKLVSPDADLDRDQLGDVLHWLRQAIGLICGIIWGAVPFTGAIWLVVFVVLSTTIVYGYYSIILKVDEDEFGGHGMLLQEGLVASFTLFLLAIFFFFMHKHMYFWDYHECWQNQCFSWPT